MKNKLLTGLATGLLVVWMAGMANASPVTVTFTTDNFITAWYVDSVSQTPLPAGYDIWQVASSATFDVLPGLHTIVWNTVNAAIGGETSHTPGTVVPSGNPAAFLGQITGNISGGPLYTSAATTWQYSIDNGASWLDVVAFGNNGAQLLDDQTTNLWTAGNGGPVEGISNSAKWIWAAPDEQGVYPISTQIKATFTTPVPEPGVTLLFGLGVAGFVGVIRRRKEILD